MTERGTDAVVKDRIYWLDNLRTFMILFVVLIHVGIVYESSGFGTLFWIVSDPSNSNLFEILNLVIDIFVMSAMFFIAGYFTPPSMKSKNGWAFFKSKFKRLMIPWVIAVMTLIPFYKVIFLYSRNLPQEGWASYLHWSNGMFSQSWLWFLPVLFLFDILYLFLSRLNINISKISLKAAIRFMFLMGLVYSFCMVIFGGQGWTKTILLDFQNERLLVYFLVFLSGSLCYKLKTFESVGKSKKFYIALSSTAWIPVALYLSLIRYSMKHPGGYLISEIVDALLIALTLLLSMLCLLYVTINTFRYFLNISGKTIKELNKNSYGVYILHVVVLGGIALPLLKTAIPSLLKYLILTVSTFAACNLIVSFYRKFVKQRILRKFTEEKI
ncbi:MAG: acyltransferase [Candidatus Aminicenantes bacterium]|nr:acyltransferase [Candidatus Aminicenantes bacterium]